MILRHADNSRGDNRRSDSRRCKFNGFINDMKISPDGQRIAITFSGKEILALNLLVFGMSE